MSMNAVAQEMIMPASYVSASGGNTSMHIAGLKAMNFQPMGEYHKFSVVGGQATGGFEQELTPDSKRVLGHLQELSRQKDAKAKRAPAVSNPASPELKSGRGVTSLRPTENLSTMAMPTQQRVATTLRAHMGPQGKRSYAPNHFAALKPPVPPTLNLAAVPTKATQPVGALSMPPVPQMGRRRNSLLGATIHAGLSIVETAAMPMPARAAKKALDVVWKNPFPVARLG